MPDFPSTVQYVPYHAAWQPWRRCLRACWTPGTVLGWGGAAPHSVGLPDTPATHKPWTIVPPVQLFSCEFCCKETFVPTLISTGIKGRQTTGQNAFLILINISLKREEYKEIGEISLRLSENLVKTWHLILAFETSRTFTFFRWGKIWRPKPQTTMTMSFKVINISHH